MLDDIKNARQNFRKALSKSCDITTLQREWSCAIDRAVVRLTKNKSRFAVMALGGYGRQEMAPCSDVDLLFICDGPSEKASEEIREIIYPLMEAGLDAGGASRSLCDCDAMFDADVKAATAMLDARFVAGDQELAEYFFKILKIKRDDKKWCKRFARMKYLEQQDRFRRYGDSVFVLEPNIKEGEGGLREYSTACWIAQTMQLDWSPPEPMQKAYELLRLFRSFLHFEFARQEDRLTFERQELMAKQLGISPESFMDRYYAATSAIHKHASLATAFGAPFIKRIAKKIRLKRIRTAIGSCPTWQKIVANKSLAARALFYLHDEGKLKELIHSFARISHKAQYGAYHVYTVDIHSILTVQRICELDCANGQKLFSSVYKKIKRKDLLLLAALLHDIGKGFGAEHAERGAVIAKEEAIRLGYSIEEAENVSFLVGSHLLMPKIAFSRDLNDAGLIEKFAASVGSLERLRMLFVLTYGDISSIGPEVWTNWKEKLLGNLFLETKHYFEGAHQQKTEREATSKKADLIRSFSGNLFAAEWLDSMPERYFATNSKQAIAMHIEMFEAFRISSELSDGKKILLRHVHADGYSELAIMAPDAHGLFAKIAGAIAGNNINILEAELNLSSLGLVLDVLKLQNESGQRVLDGSMERLERDIEAVVTGKNSVEEMLARRARALKKRGVTRVPKVEIDNDVAAYYSVVDIYAGDRVGLLSDVAKLIAQQGYSIEVAKILTKGDLAQDSFYLKDLEGKKISSKERAAELINAMMEVLK